MIGYCKKLMQEIISEADCHFCDDVDLTCCRHWRESNESPKPDTYSLLDDGWRDARKEFPSDGCLLLYVDVDGWKGVVISTIAKGTCASYFDKDILAWMPLPDPPTVI